MPIDDMIYVYVANEETYPDNAVILKEGSKGNWVYVILDGQVKVKKSTSKGMLTLHKLGEGDIFGELALFEPGTPTRTESIVADGPVRVGLLDSSRLVRDYERVSPQLKGLIRSLSARLKQTTGKVCDLALELM